MSASLVAKGLAGGHGHRTLFDDLDLTVAPGDVVGVVGALLAAIVIRRTVVKGGGGAFMMELPKYQMPRLRDVAIGLWQRAAIFLKRAGGIILITTLILWALASFPVAGPGQKQSEVSIAG